MTPRSSDSISTGTLTLLFSERGPLLLIQDPDLASERASTLVPPLFAPRLQLHCSLVRIFCAIVLEPRSCESYSGSLLGAQNESSLEGKIPVQRVGVDPGGGFSGAICDVDYASAITHIPDIPKLPSNIHCRAKKMPTVVEGRDKSKLIFSLGNHEPPTSTCVNVTKYLELQKNINTTKELAILETREDDRRIGSTSRSLEAIKTRREKYKEKYYRSKSDRSGKLPD
ncbi:hypothetical protein MBM_00683 [Drepanopeziza brunnea f. sp. 'multigermtubi' MB_m1]|uniref:Uncharacterized protein n=1 Tax=Marssonina brunnea f. sp. multigermtubi (strain MB_m1) TaxID=1072389 RepID=K1WVB4_MARBU|nr:uncharacterized protein MBM_00683 [Drepanopeziza brunnea f. sp. 'multigermtubi' MB_m1]EKD21570.1 hypothetical protein MBM_00683 [Drepanopeziza brunnea f. sp. 'multigermtubi' MB_m1]